MFKKILFFLLLLFTLAASAEDVLKLIGNNHEFFSKPKDTIVTPGKGKNFFMWTSESKTEAYYPAEKNGKEFLTLYGFKVVNGLVRFNNDRPEYLCLTLYGNGENSIRTADSFRKDMMKIFVALKKRYPKYKPKMLKRKSYNGSNMGALIWKSGKYACIMKWGIKGDSKTLEEPEFLQIEFELIQPGKDPLRRGIVETNYDRPYGVQENRYAITRESNGDVYLAKFPMYNQGAKGNSAAAVVQRILEYHGKKPAKPVTAAPLKKGTKLNSDIEELQIQLESVCQENKLKLKDDFIFFEGNKSARKLNQLVNRYNRHVKKSNKKKLTAPKSGKAGVAAIFKQMDPAVLAQIRNEDHAAMTFQGDIMRNVMGGHPLIWYTVLGVVKEKNLPAKPPLSQMRIIIGFNNLKKTVIYTDNWGKGHEVKSMPFDQAWSITLAAYTITLN